MYCRNCGKELDANSKFCPQCGTPYISQDTEADSSSVQSEKAPMKMSKRIVIAIGIGCAVIVALLVAFVLFRQHQESDLIYSLAEQLQDIHEEWIEETYATYYDNITYHTVYDDISLKRNGFTSYTMIYPLELIPRNGSVEEPSVYVTITADITTNLLLSTYSFDSTAEAELPYTAEYNDFIGEFLILGTDSWLGEELWIEQNGFELNIGSIDYRILNFEKTFETLSAWPEIKGNYIRFTADSPYSSDTYDITLIYTPKDFSPYNADTIYMKSEGLFDTDTVYIRAE